MGRRGPTAKPLELKLLEGNRGHRPLDLGEKFRPEAGIPTLSKFASPGARKVARRLGPILYRHCVISPAFVDIFEEMCETITDVNELRHSLRARQALLRSQGKDPAEAFESQTPGGMPVQHPRYQILKSERQMMYTLLAKFGLSPAEQANVTTAIRAQLTLFEGGASSDTPTPNEPRRKPTSFAEFQ